VDFAALKGKYGQAAKKITSQFALGTSVSRHLLSSNTSGNHNNGPGHRLRGDGPGAHEAAVAAAAERRKARLEGREAPAGAGLGKGEAHPLNFRLYSRAYGGRGNKHAAAENYMWREQLEANLRRKRARQRELRDEVGLPPVSNEGSLSAYDGLSFLSQTESSMAEESQLDDFPRYGTGGAYCQGYDNDGRYQQQHYGGGDSMEPIYSSTDEDWMNHGRIDRRYLSDLSGQASYIHSGAQEDEDEEDEQLHLEALPPSPQRAVRNTTIRLAPEKLQ
jgi:hypothetical protein